MKDSQRAFPMSILGAKQPCLISARELCMDDADYARAADLIRFICPNAEWSNLLVIEGNPHSKARPRISKQGHLYQPDATEERGLRLMLRKFFDAPKDGNIGVGCIFFRKDRHRIDADNMLKHVMDAATTVAWHDDCQVTAQVGVVEVDERRPRSVIAIAPHISTMDRSAPAPRKCRTCRQPFSRWGSGPFCSRRCASLSRGHDLRAVQQCAVCSKPFKRVNYKQIVCSEVCRLVALETRNKEGAEPLPKCVDCGKQLSRHGYVRCRSCFLSPDKSEKTPEALPLFAAGQST